MAGRVLVLFSRSELDHLLTLLRDANQDGSYYGNREQYRRRQERLWKRLEDAYKATGREHYPLRSRDEQRCGIERCRREHGHVGAHVV